MSDPASPRIFVSHAHADKELVDKLLDTFITGMGIRRACFSCSSLPGLAVPLGDQYLSRLREELANCDRAILVLTPNFYKSVFSICEMGAAWALGKTVWPMVVPPLTVANVTDVLLGTQLLSLEAPSALDTLADELARLARVSFDHATWADKRDRFRTFLQDWRPSLPHATTTIVLDRGDVLDNMIDCVMYLPSGPPQLVRTQLIESIRARTVLPTTYAYLGESGLQHWLDLTTDPGYQTYQESARFFNDNARSVADEILNAVGDRTIDFVSLGPGNGQKDHDIVDALVQGQEPEDEPHYYYPLDINADMIAVAVRRLRANDRIAQRIRIKAIVADFGKLQLFRPVFEFRHHPNVLALLGNTLGNLQDDLGFLENSYEAFTSPKDLLLLEVNTVGGGAQLGDTRRNKRFDFGPLEILGVRYEASKLIYQKRRGLGRIPKTETTVAIYGDVRIDAKTYTDVRLSYIHEYDLNSLEQALDVIGFQLIREYRQEHSAVLLLRRGQRRL